MKKIKIDYNPYLREAMLEDGDQDSWLEEQNGRDFESWCAMWLVHLIEKYHDDISIEFSGIEKDCETLEDCVASFNKNSINFHIELIKNEIGDLENEDFGKIKSFYDEARHFISSFKNILEMSPLDDSEVLKFHSLDEVVYRKLDEDFEIAVMGASGSGKSSLINAMLGYKLLPSGAKTNKLFCISDESSSCNFCCEYVDKDGMQKSLDPVSVEDLGHLNNDDSSDIHIYGNLSSISSQELKLRLTDVPSESYNNCEEERCKYYVSKVLKDSNAKPLVLFVLEGTQLATKDDVQLLEVIAQAMKVSGRQTKDRFLFILNKADECDSEKGESIEEILAKTKAYLQSFGIENPRIFPCSAYYACLVRQHLKGDEFSKKEKLLLEGNVSLFVEDRDRHFSNMAPLSKSIRDKIEKQLTCAEYEKNDYKKALVHTGIPAIEHCIREYVQKYAVPMKMAEALTSFKSLVDDLPEICEF